MHTCTVNHANKLLTSSAHNIISSEPSAKYYFNRYIKSTLSIVIYSNYTELY